MARVRVSAVAAPARMRAADGAPSGVFLEGCEGDLAGGEREEGVAIEQGVGGADGAGQTILGHLGEFSGLDLGQFQIGGHHADGGVADGLGGRGVPPSGWRRGRVGARIRRRCPDRPRTVRRY